VQAGRSVGNPHANVALEEALKGNVQYTYRSEDEAAEAAKPEAAATADEDEE